MKVKNVEINKWIPVMISKYTYLDMQEQIKQAEDGTMAQCNLRRDIEKKFKEYKEEQERLIKFKDNKILGLEKRIKELEIKIKEDFPKVITRKLNSQKGGYVKQINILKNTISGYRLKAQLKEKEFKALEEKNNNQALKIKELLDEQGHTIEEYMNDGLPHKTKKALLKKNRRK
jgi:hypothetical protein